MPVLSNTTWRISLNVSRLEALRKRIPFLAARPKPTAMAAGVARPMAHGQLITNTAIALMSDVPRLLSATVYVRTKVSNAIPITTGTNTALILSAIFCMGGFSPCASCTIFKMPLNTVSFPVAVTCAFTRPLSNTDPPIRKSFFCLLTGKLSPVMMASLTIASPHNILQSMGTCSPFFINTKSPVLSCVFSTGKTCSWCLSSKAIILAISFWLLAKDLMARCVDCIEVSSI